MPNRLGDLPIVDAHELPGEVRALLRPGETMRDRDGVEHVLPRWFYEVESWECALETDVAPHFMLWEFMTIDVREAERFRQRFPRYAPCTIALLASALEVFRDAVGTYVHIAANGGYRTPAHELSRHASRHCWASAANIYRVGDDWLDSRDTIRKYADVVRNVLPGRDPTDRKMGWPTTICTWISVTLRHDRPVERRRLQKKPTPRPEPCTAMAAWRNRRRMRCRTWRRSRNGLPSRQSAWKRNSFCCWTITP